MPGDVEAYYEAPIYARVPGYLKMWYKDIGAQVKAGEQLAVIDTPDLDQQLAQAKSDLASVQANATLADLTAKRWKSLLASQSVSQQTVDEKVGDAAAKKALVAASQANVDRLQALENFKYITAPFDGVVTARETDIGALINAGSGSGVELFKVADIHQMRVYVRVPQAYASQLHPGLTANLKLAQYPQRDVQGDACDNLKRDREGIADCAGRTDGGQQRGQVVARDFRRGAFPTSAGCRTSTTYRPARWYSASMGWRLRPSGRTTKSVLKPITVGRDLGTEIEVVSGLDPSDRVIDSPPDSITSGDLVKVASDKPNDAKAARAGQPEA